MAHDIWHAGKAFVSRVGKLSTANTHTEMMVKGMIPQLPINEGLTMQPEIDLSREQIAS